VTNGSRTTNETGAGNRAKDAMADAVERRARVVDLLQRVAAARVQSIAVCADAAATLQSIHRELAARRRRLGKSDGNASLPARRARHSR